MRDGRKTVGTNVLVGVEVSTRVDTAAFTRVGAAVFVRADSGVVLTMVVAVAVAARGVGGANKARKPFETGDQKITMETRAARIANKKKEMNTQKLGPRPGFLRGFEDGGDSGGVLLAGGTS